MLVVEGKYGRGGYNSIAHVDPSVSQLGPTEICPQHLYATVAVPLPSQSSNSSP
jgi:hypothetical protein